LALFVVRVEVVRVEDLPALAQLAAEGARAKPEAA